MTVGSIQPRLVATVMSFGLPDPTGPACNDCSASATVGDERGASVQSDRKLIPAPPGSVRAAPPDDGPAPSGPGGQAYWTSANKVGVGTANNFKSKVWFTLTGGRLTEVYYPRLDQANIRELKFVVSDGETFAAIDSEAPLQKFRMADDKALAYTYEANDPAHGYVLSKTYITDPKRNVVLMDVTLKSTSGKPLDLYVVVDPAVGNVGQHNHSVTCNGSLVSENDGTSCAVTSSIGFEEACHGFAAASDPLIDLLTHHKLTHHYSSAHDGNVMQVAKIASSKTTRRFTLALGFGGSSAEAVQATRESLQDGFGAAYKQYVSEWSQYLGGLQRVEPTYQHQYDVGAMVLKAHEDKENPGAFVASMTVPWGQQVSADGKAAGGYHLVWARDEYHTASAMYAEGDKGAANRALDYLFNHQQKSDGSFPQNTWLSGQPYFPSLQMDEVGYPMIHALLVERTDADTYKDHIKPAANFLIAHGPYSPQERWEESAGYSPSTIAAEIAGLVAAGLIAEKNADVESASRFLQTANEWARNVEKWTATTTGPHGDHYYIRISDNATPDDGNRIWLNNGGGNHDKREILDMGFLELVRLGVKSPHDELIAKTMEIVERLLKVDTPKGPGYHRYNHDGYGEKVDGRDFDGTGVGRLWPLLEGEKGEYILARGGDPHPYLDSMMMKANEGGMIPEQVWDRSNKLYDSNLTLGDAAQRLRFHFGDVCNADGNQDGYISRNDLVTVLGQEWRPLDLRQAAQFLVDHPNLLQMLDVASGQGGIDDRIGLSDLDTAIAWYGRNTPHPPVPTIPAPLVIHRVAAGDGHGTGSAAPLVWAMAEFNRLALGAVAGHVAGVPAALAQHFEAANDTVAVKRAA